MRHATRSLFLLIMLHWSAVSIIAQSSNIANFGYGASATGDNGLHITLVSSLSELKNALPSKVSNKTIIITRDITVTGVIDIKDGSNLTIMALPGVKLITNNWNVSLEDPNKQTGIFNFVRMNNVVLRNLTMEGPGSYDCDGRDLITFESVTNAWVDHCDFSDAVDDCFDIKKLSDNITVSWCHFHYDKAYHPNGPGDASGDKDHRFVNLLGSGSGDKPSDGIYNVTWAYCWWDEGCMQRMVRCRNAELHFLGCYWNSSKASYYIGPENVKVYVELCTFEGGPKTANIFKSYGGTNAFKAVNSYAKNGLPANSGSVSDPSYSGSLTRLYTSAAEAKNAVTDATCGAGATLDVTTAGVVTSGCNAVVRTEYTITFNVNGGSCSMSAQRGYEGENTTINPCIFAPASGKTFAGWNTASNGSGTAYADQGTIVLTANVTLYAQWATAYTVTYNSNGHGTAPASQTVASGQKLTEPAALTESGYVFGGWYRDQACTNAWNFATMTVTSNMTLYAKWTEKTCDEQVWYNYAGDIPQGSAQASCFTFGTTPSGSSACDVTMDIEGSEYHASKRSGDWNSTIQFTIPAGQTGVFYISAKSSGSNRTVTLSGTTAGTMTITSTLQTYSSVTLNPGDYTITSSGNLHIAMLALQLCGGSVAPVTKYNVTFDANGHGTAPAAQQVVANGRVTEPAAPTASDFIFGGWYKEAVCTNPWSFSTDLVTSDITLYAKWTVVASSYTVTFNNNGHGSAPDAQNITSGNAATEPDEPTADGYVFGGWYTTPACDGDAWDFETPITNAITLYAKWTENLTSAWSLTGELETEFVKNAGESTSIVAYATLRLNANTTYEYNLYNGSAKFTTTTVVSASAQNVVFAQGAAVARLKTTVEGNYEFRLDYTNPSAPMLTITYPASFTVTFSVNGHGDAPANQTVASGALLREPTAPTATGYVFGGWYREAGCTNAWNFATMTVTGNMTLYAKWTEAAAQTDQCWNISDGEFSSLGTISATTTVNGLTIYATSTSTVAVEANNKSCDGKNFTHRLKLGGTGAADARTLSFAVSGPCTIDIYAISSSGSADRTLTVRAGSFSGQEIGTASAPGATVNKTSIVYTGAGANNIYIYSPSSGVNIYDICVTYGATATYSITYEMNGHGTQQSPVASATALPSTLPTPSASGWMFDGWFTNSALTIVAIAGTPIYSNTTLYAKWTQQQAVGGYTISYNLNGHGTSIPDVQNATALPNPLPTPTADGYTFGGWYTNSALTISAVPGSAISANTMLYAKWTASETPIVPSSGTEGGWFESCWMEFDKGSYSNFVGYVSGNGGTTWIKLDEPLVRSYASYGRVDALGLAAGTYMLKVVPVVGDAEDCENAIVSGPLTVKSHDRHGFAHLGGATVGAYNNDGTLKSDARVLYVSAATAKTVKLKMKTSASAETELTGLQAIIAAYEKGVENRPLAIRIIGTIKAEDMDAFGSTAEGLQIKGKGYTAINLTLEGVGKDAAIHGFGILARNIAYVEFRNFGILDCMDDCLGLDTKNEHVWIHNIDFYYGQAGSAADQVKGDGTVDLKGDSRYVTIAYNHFFDSGKMSLCGMKSETGPNYISYHHNWFDHSDSRHPRIRTMSVHIYNNYYDGNAKYGVGMTMGGSAFVESNYFRNCPKPMLISGQGTDATGEGTFSGETGGVIKSYNNYMSGSVSYITQRTSPTSFDAYEVSRRDEAVPSNVVAVSGGTIYDNFDTNSNLMYAVTPDDPTTIPSMVTGVYGAGRLQHGDLQFTFNNATEDANYKVNTTLKSMVVNYTGSTQSTLGKNDASDCAPVVGFNVIAQVDPAGYGTVSQSLVSGVADATTISKSSNVLTIGSIQITATPTAETAEYTYAFSDWSWTPAGATITANTTATATFTRTARNYTLTWNADGGTIPSGAYTSGSTAFGTPIIVPANPTKSGYTFLGWSPAPAETMPAANTTYTAQWRSNSAATTYTITYDMNGHGDQIAQVLNVTALPAELPTPTADGYTFDGWYTNAGLEFEAIAGATINANTTLYAKWTQNVVVSGYEWWVVNMAGNNPFYTVSGGYSSSKGSVTYNAVTYDQCLKMETTTSISFTLTQTMTLTLVFDVASKHVQVDGETQTTNANGIVTIDLLAGTHTIKKIDSMNLFYMNLSGGGVLETYDATIVVAPADYGTVSVSSVNAITAGTAITTDGARLTIGSTTVTATAAAATAEYTYSFGSWTWTPDGATVTADVAVTANFVREPVSYTLTWDADGGELTGEYTSGSVPFGTTIVAPTPTRDGYRFIGWNTTPAATMPAANTTYTAKWEVVIEECDCITITLNP